mmetsp:Transcript_31369/g.65467  ORF Transcript_31369/g.65467 Transcript_31369/m.65467 type:complete len:290 (+) Transcript_31369:930-1799(+)
MIFQQVIASKETHDSGMEPCKGPGHECSKQSNASTVQDLNRFGPIQFGHSGHGPNVLDGQSCQGSKDGQTNLTRENGFNGMFKVFDTKTTIDFEGKQTASDGTPKKGRQGSRHSHEGMFANQVAIGTTKNGTGNESSNGGTNGHQRRFRSQTATAQNTKKGGSHHGHDVIHGNIRLFVNALDGVGQIPRFSHDNDCNAHTGGEGESQNGNPQPIERFTNTRIDKNEFGQVFPKQIQHVFQGGIINKGGRSTHNANHGGQNDGVRDTASPKVGGIFPKGRLRLDENAMFA